MAFLDETGLAELWSITKEWGLKDPTKSLYGLGTDAVPDDVFGLLSRFQKGLGNEYVWARSDGVFVNSPDPNAYPIDDGYTYTALGQLGNKVQIATGSYTGTGTYGNANPSSLTFDFAPKVVFIYYKDVMTTDLAGILFNNSKSYILINADFKPMGANWQASFSGNTVSWYGNTAENQLNNANRQYGYTAIG